jgi:uncharacterized protein (TIGR03382 family)
MHGMRSTLLLLVVTSLALSAPRRADACGPVPCRPAAFVPHANGRIPANMPGLYWRPMSSYETIAPDPEKLALTSAADPTTPIAFTAQSLADGGFLLVPAAPLTPGDHVVRDSTVCEVTGRSGEPVPFSVTPTAPMPSDLGALVADPASMRELDLVGVSGTCSDQTPIDEVTIRLVPSAEAAPWFDVLHFETWVDGKRWEYETYLDALGAPGESPVGRGVDRVFQTCGTAGGLAAGKHVVTMRATLPGTTQVAASSPVEVSLKCDDGTSGCSATTPGAAPWLGLALLAVIQRARRRTA